MLRLIRGPGQERGSVAVIVALVVGMLVLTGAAALAIDAGGLYSQRRVVQNGADAASLALAQICAKNIADPLCADKTNLANTATLKTYLTGLAVANATADNPPSIFEICGGGTDAQPKFGDCLSGTALTDCPVLPTWLPANANWVQVKTRTFVPRIFAGLGTSAYSGKTVQACARAAWGQASITASVPLTLSACEWDRATANGTYYAPQPSGASPFYGGGAPQADWPNAARTPPLSTLPTPLPANGQEVVIYLQDHEPQIGGVPYDSGCYVGSSNGHDAPGSFGWVDSTSCVASVSTDNWVKTDTGGDTPNACKDVVDSIWKTVTFLPVYDCTALGPQTGPVPNPLPTPTWCETGNGLNTYYHIKGWARFYLSGYHLPSADKVSPASNSVPCSGGERCISGWFLKGLVDAPITITTPDSNFGVKGVAVVG